MSVDPDIRITRKELAKYDDFNVKKPLFSMAQADINQRRKGYGCKQGPTSQNTAFRGRMSLILKAMFTAVKTVLI